MKINHRGLYIFGLIVNDSLVIYGSFFLAYWLRFFCAPLVQWFPIEKGLPQWSLYATTLQALIPLWLLVFALFGRLYQRRFVDLADEFLSILKCVLLSALLMTMVTFVYRSSEYSRLVMFWGCLLALIFMMLSRFFLKGIFLRTISFWVAQETVLLIGKGKSIDTLKKILSHDQHRRFISLDGQNFLEIKQQLEKDSTLQEMIISGHLLQDPQLEEILDLCQSRNVEIKILPDLLELRLGEITVDDSLGLPILHLKPLSLHGFRFAMKRVFDVLLSLFILTVFFFPLILIALLIMWESEGGAFFIQDRVGHQEKIFKCVKFRTMRENAERILREMNLPSFRGGPAFKMKRDPRITRVGKVLRKLSLDELPQIWNILRGEMSFIGPRPQVLAEAQGNPEWAKKRFRILPGITGLWQVSGRADLSYEDMMRLDIYYLENWSPGLDLKIILKTFPVVLSSKGAY